VTVGQPTLFGDEHGETAKQAKPSTPEKPQKPRTPCPLWLAEQIARLSKGTITVEKALTFGMRQAYAVRDKLKRSAEGK
jgi:hypothetical protein